jgi:methyl-accepting chemotaxis protein
MPLVCIFAEKEFTAMLKNLKLAVKIGGGFGVVIALSVLTCIITLNGLSSITGSVDRSTIARSIVENTQTAMVAGKNFVITKDAKYIQTVHDNMASNQKLAAELKPQVHDKNNIARLDEIIAGSSDYDTFFTEYTKYETEKQALLADMVRISAEIDGAFVRLEKQAGGSSAIALENRLLSARLEGYKFLAFLKPEYIDNLQANIGDLVSALERTPASGNARALVLEITAKAKQYADIAVQFRKKVADQTVAQGSAVTASGTAIAKAKELNESGMKLISSTETSTRITVLLISLLGLLLGVAIGVLLTRAITSAMAKGVSFAEKMAEGDLTAETGINQKDEIGALASSLDLMKERLQDLVTQIQAAAQQVSSGSQQLSATSQQMSQGASEQAASLEEISSSMEQMTSNIRQNAENALTTEKIAQKSAQIAEEGGKAVNETVEAMRLIATKITIIEEIARSTNMLALNASIEAARAGEFGKGFAVVASEVGKLAERSQKEAGEISKLSGESVQIAERAGTTINGMIPEIRHTAELVQEISAASNEQNTGASQINTALLQLDQVVQQNATSSEESASMSEELASQSEEMQGTISFFRVDKKHASQFAEKNGTGASPRKAATPIAKTAIPKPATAKPPLPKQAIPKGAMPTRSTGVRINLDDDTAASRRDSIDDSYEQF